MLEKMDRQIEHNEVSCSIVIVNWKSIDYLIGCIESIKKNTEHTYEIIVIDNFSGIDEQERLKKLNSVRLILNNKNIGFAAANNQGFKIANGKYVLMLNPDTIILNGAIDKMIDFLECHETIYAVGPKLYYSEKLDYHHSVKRFPSPFSQFLHMMPFSKIIRNLWTGLIFNPDKTQPVPCVWGAAIMFKKKVFDTIGYLDEERFFVYTEEVDFCKRMALQGLKLYYYPQAKVIHFGGKSQQKSSVHKNRLIWTSLINYFLKYYPLWMVRLSMYSICVILKLKVVLLKRDDLYEVINVIEEKLRA